MAKGDKFYFENFASSAALSKEAADYLVNCLENYNPDKLGDMVDEMHTIEHRADKKKHEMNQVLAKAFVTPVDREDLAMLSQQLDDVADKIEEVLQTFYINNVRSVQPAAVEFAKLIVRSCDALHTLMTDFEYFKRSKKIHDQIVALNDLEEECDRLYLKSMRAMSEDTMDVRAWIAWRDVYAGLEACVDACEHVSECVGTVIMKNT